MINKEIGLKVKAPVDVDSDYIMSHLESATMLDRLVMVDKKDGSKWEISIFDGKITIEPFELVNKRDFRISNIGF